MIDAPIDSIKGAGAHFEFNSDDRIQVVEAIRAFRDGKISVKPGGGGKYGVIELKTGANEEGQEREKKQLSLIDF